MGKENDILAQLDQLTDEIGNVTALVEKTEVFRSFNQWLQERHEGSEIECEINRYADLLSIDSYGTITKANSLLQIKYNDKNRNKRRPATVEPSGTGDAGSDND
jgi:methylaspartate ammonia-lyase